MAERIVLYGKQMGEPCVPLTIRLEWLPDGTIKPLMYWTQDGTCYKVISQAESVRLAFLQEHGEGLRFKVKSEIIDTPEPHSDLLHTLYETYLYMADKRFSERNIIDQRYGHAGKEFIPVTLDVFPDGDYEIIYFWVHGDRYMVEKTDDVEPRGSFHAGGVGIWHKVVARLINADDDDDPDPCKSVRRPAALYLELNKWFVTVAPPA